MELPNKRPSLKNTRVKPIEPNVEQVTDLPEVDSTSLLPGFNPYDAAVKDGVIDYNEAKTREEVLRVREVTERERISTERERISLEKDRLGLLEARGELIRRDENIARLKELATAFQELLRMTINEAALSVPVTGRDEFQVRLTSQASAAMHALAECVSKKLNHEQVASEMLKAFTSESRS